MDKKFSHLDNKGNARIVDISKKKKSSRYASAKATVWLSKKILTMVKNDNLKKEMLLMSLELLVLREQSIRHF